MKAIFILIVIQMQLLVEVFSINPIVETNVGTIRGLQSSDGDYDMFLGIPYANVDKKYPFRNSSPHPKFDDIFDAYDGSAICPQKDGANNTIIGTLDCLHLNVYVPNSVNTTEKLPVMVFVHGGSFTTGSADRFLYGAKYLVRHGVILVTLNYRVGPYGFMCIDTPEVPGNQGLKDQLIALRWVKHNIESFGGDVDKITLFGNSAGGRSAELQLLYSKDNENLFRNIIVQSGSAFSSQVIVYSDATVPMRMCEQLGFSTNDMDEAMSYLSAVDTNLVIEAAVNIEFEFRPCVEKQFPDVDAFMADYPINKKIPKANGMSIMTGFNSYEFLNFAMATPSEIKSSDYFNIALNNSFHFGDDKIFSEIEYLVRRYYIGDEEVDIPSVLGVVDFRSDMMYNYAADRSIGSYMKNGAENVFYYLFSYSGGRNYLKKIYNITLEGAAHADEIGYLFEMELFPEIPTSEDQLVLDRMTTMWTNFAKYGHPTPTISELLPVKWEGISRGSVYHYLNIDSELSLGKRPYHQRMAFWDLFYDTYADYEKGALTSSTSASFSLLRQLLFSISCVTLLITQVCFN